jgi:hypothetical protein
MSDNMGKGSTSEGNATPANTASSPAAGGLIDVNGMSFEELSAAIGPDHLGRALDYILASGQNGSGYHGFNNRI